MDNNERWAFLRQARAIAARRRLETISDLACLLTRPDDPERTDYLIGLANQAYPDDAYRRAQLIEAITKKRR
jgi:hypothetical protein